MSLIATNLSITQRLQPTSLRLPAGQLAVVIGPNGSGKTSLLHALAGIGRPGGSVTIEGKDPRGLRPGQLAHLLAYVPASRDVAWPLIARDLVLLGLPAPDPVAVDEVLSLLELGGVADRRMDRLSTGERSRVLIARALVAKPRLLLLDEPTANLDPLWQLRLMELLRRLTREEGRTALVALHDLDLAGRYADRLLVMSGGRIAADGEPRKLLHGTEVERIFGIRRTPDGWQPLA